MDKTIIIAGLNYWRTEAPKALLDLGFVEDDIATILKTTDFKKTERPEKLGEKFQVCLREFARVFKKARQLDVYNTILSKALEVGYEKSGARRGAGIDEFLHYVIARDMLIGLKTGGEKINNFEFTYWIEDMFLPLCKNYSLTLEEYEEISTYGYLRTKMNYFLPNPNEWKAEMILSPFDSDRTEWRIYREQEYTIALPKKPLMDAIAA